MSFTGNDILLSSRLLSVTGPLSISQNGSGVVNITVSSIPATMIQTGENNTLDKVLAAYDGSFTTLSEDLASVEEAVGEIDNRIGALEKGSVDLSNYTATDGIKLTASGSSGIKFYTSVSNAPITINDSPIITEAILNSKNYVQSSTLTDYQRTAEKNAANGYAGLDASSKLSVSQIPVDSATIVVNQGVLAVADNKFAALDANNKISAEQIPISSTLTVTADNKIDIAPGKFAPLNADNKIDRSYLGTINIQECYGVNVDSLGVITMLDGFSVSDIEIGDAVVINSGAGEYKTGSFYYRTVVKYNDMTDFVPFTRDIVSASKDQVNAGTSSDVYITPSSLNGSAPSLLGTNFSNIPGTAVSVTTGSTQGTVKVTVGNGLNLNTGTISVSVASTTAFGTVKVTTGNGLSLSSGVISMGVASATSSGAVILNGKGIQADSNGSFSVSLVTDTETLTGNGGSSALGVKLSSTGAIIKTSTGLALQVDTSNGTLAIENNKLVNKAVSQGELEEALKDVGKAQAEIQVSSSNYVKNNTYGGGIITTAVGAIPKGVRSASGTFFAVSPISVSLSDGIYTCEIDLTGLSALDSGTWYIVF